MGHSTVIRSSLLILSLSMTSGLVQAGNESRNLSGFHSILVSGGISLTVHQGNQYHVSTNAGAGSQQDILTSVNGDTLIISKVEHWYSRLLRFIDYDADVTLPELSKITSTDNSDAEFVSDFNADNLSIVVSGGGDIDFMGKVNTLNVIASGGSDLTLVGSATTFTMIASDGSELDGKDFTVNEANFTVSGGSDLTITVHDKLTVNASGGSRLHYDGHPTQTDIHSGSGSDVKAY